MLIYTSFLWQYILSSYLTNTQYLKLGYIKCTPYVEFLGILLDIVFYQYVREGVSEETSAKNTESVHCYQFLLGRFGPSCLGHRWELYVLHYNEIMVIYPYPFLVVINLFFYWIIFINDCICIWNGSPG